MSGKISYLKWRNRLEEITPSDHRIGTDVLLIEDGDATRAEWALQTDSFKLDMTMAIIYEKGRADLRINMKEYHVQAPAVLIVLFDQIYQPLGHSDDLKSRIILMSKSFSDSLFTNAGEVLPLQSQVMKRPVLALDNEENVFGQFFQLLLNVAASPRSDYKLDVARHLTLSMFYGYSCQKHELPESTSSASSRQEQLYMRFVDLLAKYHTQQREIAFYADKMCLTPKYLSQAVKEYSGRPASDIIDEYVLAECKSLLLSSNMSIQQISDELNFPSQSVFGKYFKRLTGLSPKDYRRQSLRL